MARPEVRGEMTTTVVARELGMGHGQLIRWMERGALPGPSYVDKNGVRYFNRDWLDKAKEIVKRKRG